MKQMLLYSKHISILEYLSKKLTIESQMSQETNMYVFVCYLTH